MFSSDSSGSGDGKAQAASTMARLVSAALTSVVVGDGRNTVLMNNSVQPLPGGRMTNGIVRCDDQVWRPLGSWSPAVHEYLRHLEAVGFNGAPRVLGVESGREILTYLDGDVPADPQWQPGHGARLPPWARTERALTGAAQLLRRLHTASVGFTPTLTDYRFHPYPPRNGQIVSHGDLGPWNTVYRLGIPVAFIALQRVTLTDVERVKYAPVGPADAAMSLEYSARQLRWLQECSANLASVL